MSSTPPALDDQVVIGDRLSSGSSFYHVHCFLGEGTFGKVAKCTRMADMKTVAIKIMKNQGSGITEAEEEASTLLKLKSLDLDRCNIVRWYQLFVDRGHICLEFEHLDRSLYDFMKERHFQPLLLKEIRPVVQQLANALSHLKTVGMIHADLKMANVMLVNHEQEPFRVKLIDFGLACDVSAAKLGSYIQTRPYRAPEIMLAHPFTEAIDMWSLGCLTAALYLGTVLYPGNNVYDMLRYIVETQGMPPDNVLDCGRLTGRFFQRERVNSTTSVWKLKSPKQFFKESGILPMETRMLRFSSLDDLLHTRLIRPEISADNAANMTDLVMFVNALKGMLELDATNRMTPRQVLEHPFTSMSHMISLYPLSSHVRSCFDIMHVCQKTLASDGGTAVCGSSTTAHIDQQNSPAETSGLSSPHFIKPHPCGSAQSTTSGTSGIKRKADDEDGKMYEASHPSKRRSCAGSSATCRRSKRKLADDEDVERQQTETGPRKRFRESSAVPSASCRSGCVISQTVKRRITHDDDDHDRKRMRKSS